MNDVGRIISCAVCVAFAVWCFAIAIACAVSIKRNWKHKYRVHVYERILAHAFMTVLCVLGVLFFSWLIVSGNYY